MWLNWQCYIKTGLSRAFKKSEILINVLINFKRRNSAFDCDLSHLDSVHDVYNTLKLHLAYLPNFFPFEPEY